MAMWDGKDFRSVVIWILVVVVAGWLISHESKFDTAAKARESMTGEAAKAHTEIQRQFAELPDKFVRLERYQRDIDGLRTDMKTLREESRTNFRDIQEKLDQLLIGKQGK